MKTLKEIKFQSDFEIQSLQIKVVKKVNYIILKSIYCETSEIKQLNKNACYWN